MENFGAAVFTAADGTTILTSITTAVSDNLPAVLIVVGGVVGVRWGIKLLNGALKGRVRA